MKNYIILFTVLFGLNAFSSAQTVFSLPEGEAVLVYSLPKTELCIEVEIEKTTQTPGEFYRYSERYLATSNVITEETTTFSLKNIRVKPQAVADPARTYSLTSSKNFPLNNISVNDKGILCGINAPCKEKTCCKETVKKETVKNNVSQPLPLTEEYMLAASTAKMAEGAAKQIYRLRESRLALLTADVDQLPADGDSFKLMLDGMDKMEKELTELFIGKTRVETEIKTVYYTPSSTVRNEVLFRVSSQKGLVAASDLSGSPYYINVIPLPISTHDTGKKNSSARPLLYSILPASTQISVGDGRNVFFSEQIFIPQFGQLVPIPEDLLQKKDVKIYIDEQTGRLLMISDK